MLTSTCTCNNNYLWLDLVEPSPVNLVSPYSGVVIRSVNVAWLVVSFHSPKHTQKYLLFLLDKFVWSFTGMYPCTHVAITQHFVPGVLVSTDWLCPLSICDWLSFLILINFFSNLSTTNCKAKAECT